MNSLISNRIGLNVPAKMITRRVVQGIAISLLGIVTAAPVAVSFTQLIGARIDGVKLQQWHEGEPLAGGCRRAKGTRGPCSAPSPWG
ncbi:hypothetical protein [Limnofasciculus baicalensis]|uniref:Uncharacterized protein n=1 Tax=Limnofasciculus baicalensis BBK-W-15 TaxID=2699891 RepID=A0AAE3H045_9CYAN|nr:hypothetical protein [Limnofasciculus baicalensis]MCP2731797.1 hypothetical protein [Limnofasciculus baicalensis BBK-W-15]